MPNNLRRNPALLVFFAALIFYGMSAGLRITGQSNAPHYVHLAYAFLHGRAYLITLPQDTHDLIFFQDKWYVIGGVAPAILMTPFVAVLGTSFSDVLFGVLVGAVNVALMYALLTKLTEDALTRIWLTVLFGAGTAHWALASVGSVWLNAQIVAVLFMILYVMEALNDQPVLAGLWLGCAALARPPIIVAALFYLAYSLTCEAVLRSAVRKLLPFGLTLLVGVAIMLSYNYIRFGNPLEFGYGYIAGTKELTGAYAASGGFNIRYMPCNIYVSLFGMPNIDLHPIPSVNEVCSHLEAIPRTFGKASAFFNPLGMSVFLATPAFMLLFRARLRDNLVVSAWIGALSVLLVVWMYHATGWVQFGYRFILDLIVFLFILFSRAIRQVGVLEKMLIGLSIFMGAVGFYLTYYAVFGQLWFEMFLELARKTYHLVF